MQKEGMKKAINILTVLCTAAMIAFVIYGIKSEENYHWHGLEITQMKRLPYLLENPVLLSDSPSRKDALLAVLAEIGRAHV